MYFPLKTKKFFYLTWLLPKNHMGFPDHVSGYTIILSSSAKFPCLHIQEQKKYFAPSTILPPCEISFFSNRLSHTILLPTEKDSAFLSCDKQPLFPILDLNLNPNWYAVSLYIIKTFQALPSLNCYLWLYSGISLVSQRKERKLLLCNASLKYMAPHPNTIINNLHATQLFI